MQYQHPAAVLAELAQAPRSPWVYPDPQHRWLLVLEVPPLAAISHLANKELVLAGLQIDPITHSAGTRQAFTGMSLVRIDDGSPKPIEGLPSEVRILHSRWSPDGSHIAFSLLTESGMELWGAEVESGRARRLSTLPLHGVFGPPCHWLPDSLHLVCQTLPSPRSAPPSPPPAVAGPVVRDSLPATTSQPPRSGPGIPSCDRPPCAPRDSEAYFFEYHATSQIVHIGLDGAARSVANPGLYAQALPSPDGEFLLVETLRPPFDSLLPHTLYPKRIELWDLRGKVVHTIAELSRVDEIPLGRDAVRPGPRNVGWRADVAATLYWSEALDGGAAGSTATVRDRVFLLPAPFTDEPISLVDLEFRLSEIHWGHQRLAVVTERWWRGHRDRRWLLDPGKPQGPRRLLAELPADEPFLDPGIPLLRSTPKGTRVLHTTADGADLLVFGFGASTEGQRPFLGQLNLASGGTKTLWRSRGESYERVVELLNAEEGVLLTRRESREQPPNYYIRHLGDGRIRQVTDFPHPAPQLIGAQQHLLQYRRQDGLPLTAKLYLPPGYRREDGPLPMLFWAYPVAYKSRAAADLAGKSPDRFFRPDPLSPLIWLTRGYAVLDGPEMPIIGEGDAEPNDSFVEQLVADAEAAVSAAVRLGVVDRNRIAVGGHSYGAFMVVNLLAHSDLFRAGVALSGAYNRTLTPFGFQDEQRLLWQAKNTYIEMSPFLSSDQISEPLLLVHGEADTNPTTQPIQSENLFHALKALGIPARLVLLPLEGHRYRAKESILHLLWEIDRWLELHVKTARQPAVTRR